MVGGSIVHLDKVLVDVEWGENESRIIIAEIGRLGHRHRPRCQPAEKCLFTMMAEPPLLAAFVAAFLAVDRAAVLKGMLLVGVDEKHTEHFGTSADSEELGVVAYLDIIVGRWGSCTTEAEWYIAT